MRTAGLHRRAVGRAGQGLVPDRPRSVRGAARHQRRQAGDRSWASRSPGCSSCGDWNDIPQCDRAQVDRWLRGVLRPRCPRPGAREQVRQRASAAWRSTRARSSSSSTAANFLETGHFWELRDVPDGDARTTDDPPSSARTRGTGLIGTRELQHARRASRRVYPPAPHCNNARPHRARRAPGRRMMERGMIIDPDHLGVLGAAAGARHDRGRATRASSPSHSWSTRWPTRASTRSAACIRPYAGGSSGFVNEVARAKAKRDPR